MNGPETVYCTQCGRPGERANAYCTHCGMPRSMERQKRAGHVAFVLNELRQFPMATLLSDTQRSSLNDQYAAQLRELIGPAAMTAARQPAPAAPAPRSAPAPRLAPAARVVTPREPIDWSWLAEQQANLFLFAGAFLTVIAAIIYVGYSGEAISAALKMALFTGYTLAFLAAGAVCLRYDRVRVAGRVFLAVGALLVPMNFAVARAVFTEEDVSAETMWLAGSIVTAGFYASVAWIGLGRMYAFGAGAAVVSAVIAFVVLTDVPVEWAPAIFIAAALVMIGTDLAPIEKLRDRIGAAWTWIGQAVAVLALADLILMAPFAYAGTVDESGFNVTTLWFLPVTLAIFAAAAAVPAIVTRRDYFALAAVATLVGAGWTVAYGADMPAEGWAITAAASALGAAVLLVAIDRDEVARRLPGVTAHALFYALHGAVATAAIVAVFVLAASATDIDPYTVEWRWFAAIAGAVAFAAYAVVSVAPLARRPGESLTVAIGAVAAAAAATLGFVYARDLVAESYVIAIAAFAAALGLLTLALRDARIARYVPARLGDVAFAGGIAAAVGAAVVSAGALSAAAQEIDPYQIDNRWFIAISGALGLAFFKLASVARRGGGGSAVEAAVISVGGIATTTAGILGVLFALERPAEDYAIAIGGIAALIALAAVVARDARIAPYAPRTFSDAAFAAGVLGTGIVGLMIVSIIAAANDDVDPYILTTRWFALPAVALCAIFFAIDAIAWKRELSVAGFALTVTAACASFVYGLHVSNEYYTFALLTPAVAVATATRWSPARIDARMAPHWRDDALLLGRLIGAGGVAIALGAVTVAAGRDAEWAPQSRWFLLPAFGLATVFSLIDASRGRRTETSATVAVAVAATALSLPYALDAHAAWYGVALAASGIALAAVGRAHTPSWIEGRARDIVSAAAVAAATLPFEEAYADHARLGAGVHIGAAFFALAALNGMRPGKAGRLLDLAALRQTRAASAWLYAAGLAATIGYIDALRAVAPDDPSSGGTLAMPMLTVTLALIACGVAARFLRPEFRLHLYAMSLLAGIASLAAAQDATVLASLLTVYVVAYAALAAFEDEPFVALPAAAYGFLMIAAWRAHADASYAVLPMTYAAAAVAAYAAALTLRDVFPRLSLGLRATGAAYALVAPAAGFALLAYAEDAEHLLRTPLYQWSTIGVAAVGLLAVIESSLTRRTWITVPASAVLLVALLLQIARFEPENVQAYTAVIGAYLVLLGAVGLARMRLLPEAAPYAQYVEALGAAIVMLPSFVQSLDADGWPYTLALLMEAVAFFSAGVTLRRRGVLSAAILALVLVAGRTLFDAINAMPNWMVAAVVGIALLGVGMGILLGRDRWERWQRSVASWWEDTSGAAPAH